jgi:acyl-CoA reductase-like NAD-dependent aldehyde dehydrogenase
VLSADGAFWANVAQASRKDARDAVVAAQAGQRAWWKMSAFNRGQVLYRWAEMAEARRAELVEHVTATTGVSVDEALDEVTRAIDAIVWYAGWSDKLAHVLGSANAVSGPFFNFSVPTATGVVVVVAPADGSLEGFVHCVGAALAGGNAVVALAAETRPTPAFVLAEMTATADFPAGVLNVLTGQLAELGPGLAQHHDVDGLDLTGAGAATAELATLAADSIKRVYRHHDDASPAGLQRLRTFIETSTVWHTIGQ